MIERQARDLEDQGLNPGTGLKFSLGIRRYELLRHFDLTEFLIDQKNTLSNIRNDCATSVAGYRMSSSD